MFVTDAGISEPRLSLEPDRIRLGFRYGAGPWSTVVSLMIRVWLVPREQNTVALEFESLHSGDVLFTANEIAPHAEGVVLRQRVPGQAAPSREARHPGAPRAVW